MAGLSMWFPMPGQDPGASLPSSPGMGRSVCWAQDTRPPFCSQAGLSELPPQPGRAEDAVAWGSQAQTSWMEFAGTSRGLVGDVFCYLDWMSGDRFPAAPPAVGQLGWGEKQ